MTTTADLLRITQAEIGYAEKPGNVVKYWPAIGLPQYNRLNAAWCGGFTYWVMTRAGIDLSWTTPKRFGYTVTGLADGRKAGLAVSSPTAGDLVFFNFPGGPSVDHVGIVTGVDGAYLLTVEGNTSPGTAGSQSNGGGVYARRRHISLAAGFVRPKYQVRTSPAPANVTPAKPAVKVVVKAPKGTGRLVVDGQMGPGTIRALQKAPRVPVDGVLGAMTRRALQKRLGVPADGVWGPGTTRALQARVGATVDGDWGPNTTRALHRALNAGRL